MYQAYRWLWTSLDWLYPPRCGGCNKAGARWCAECAGVTRLIGQDICQRCGNPLLIPGQSCLRCQVQAPAYRELRSWAIYEGPIKKAIHRLKYQGDVALGEIMARPLIGYLKSLAWPVDILMPVPAGRRRKQDRGYNQAALLARPVALGCGIPYRSTALRKIKEIRSQVGLGREERRSNVAGAFQANPKLVKSLIVLIIDDVTTSGATIEACASALLTAGATGVYGLTLTRPHPQLNQP